MLYILVCDFSLLTVIWYLSRKHHSIWICGTAN